MVLHHFGDRSLAGLLPVLSHRGLPCSDRVGGLDRRRREQGHRDRLASRVAATGRGGGDVSSRVFHSELQSRGVVQYPFADGRLFLTAFGCFTISIVSFILPPLLHMRVLPNSSKGSWYVDLVLVILGVLVMIGTTAMTCLSVFHSSVCYKQSIVG